MVGTKQEIIAKLQEMVSIEDDEVILIDLWTIKDFRDQSARDYLTDEQIAEVMQNVDADMKNEISYATVSLAVNAY